MKSAEIEIGAVAHVQGRNPALEAYRILSDALTSGAFAPGTRLPGERTLSARLGVSRSTLRHVLGALGDSERLQPSPQRGWFVADRKFVHEPNQLRGFSEAATIQGRVASATVLRNELRAALLDEAETLGLEPSAPVVHLERLRRLDGELISVEYSCLPHARVPGLECADLTDRSLYEHLRDAYGIVATRCDYDLQAEAADAVVSGLLEIAVGAPVLVGYHSTYDQNERCFDMGRQVYLGESYRFKASLFRF
jgi:GntR family transcriptional regulator